MKKLAKISPFGLTLLPGLALATTADFTWFNSLVTATQGLVDTLIPLVIAIGLLFFIWGIVQYIAASGDEAAKEEGKRKMIWGIVALFVIIAVWGLVALLVEIFLGGDAGTVPDAPGTPT